MDESRDPSRTARIDWSGAALAVLGLGGIVFGLLEWPPLGAGHPLVLSARWRSATRLARVAGASWSAARGTRCCRSLSSAREPFTLANVADAVAVCRAGRGHVPVPLNLIQVQRYTATAAGAALLPFPLIMFALSRWSGSLVARIGSRLPLTIGPVIAALRPCALRAARHRRVVLDDVLSGGRRARLAAWRSRSRR